MNRAVVEPDFLLAGRPRPLPGGLPEPKGQKDLWQNYRLSARASKRRAAINR
jgi:hypothetical protein